MSISICSRFLLDEIVEDLKELMAHHMALNEYAPPNTGPQTMHELRVVLKEIDASML
jgi:hypothetical protein